jgi:hypothetical protein
MKIWINKVIFINTVQQLGIATHLNPHPKLEFSKMTNRTNLVTIRKIYKGLERISTVCNEWFLRPKIRRHNTQHDDTQHDDTQHDDTQHDDTQHNDIQDTDTQHKGHICDTQRIWLNDTQHNNVLLLFCVIMPSVAFYIL